MVGIELVNQTSESLFVWINGITYDLDPYELKTLNFKEAEIQYFAAAPSIFPVFGTEVLQHGYSYTWKFGL